MEEQILSPPCITKLETGPKDRWETGGASVEWSLSLLIRDGPSDPRGGEETSVTNS